VLAYLVTKLARSLSAQRRHTIWLVVLLLLAVLPAARFASPTVRLPLLDTPIPWFARPAASVPEPPPPPDLPALDPSGSVAGGRRSASAWVPLALSAVWAVGALLVAARPFAGRVALAMALRSDPAQPGPEALVDSLARAAGLRTVRTMAHPRVTMPFVVGLLRPRILLPLTWSDWSREKLEAVLVHELFHLKRRDALSNAAAQLACALVWFNPLAWVARAMLLQEAELACDGEVLARGIRRTGYASTIVAILREADGVPLRASWPALGRKRMLKDRVMRILLSRKVPRRSCPSLPARAVTLAFCLLSPLVLLSVSLRGADRLSGAWQERSAAAEACADRQTWNEDGSGSMAFSVLPDVPAALWRYLIEKKWTDSGGSIWYHIRLRCSGMPSVLYTLVRLDPAGDSYEMTDSPLGYPDGFSGPPGNEKHRVYTRLK
jgi:beta-lactamase regulating signal transducer with metallopeptidase domain